jgi:hypothetical protein
VIPHVDPHRVAQAFLRKPNSAQSSSPSIHARCRPESRIIDLDPLRLSLAKRIAPTTVHLPATRLPAIHIPVVGNPRQAIVITFYEVTTTAATHSTQLQVGGSHPPEIPPGAHHRVVATALTRDAAAAAMTPPVTLSRSPVAKDMVCLSASPRHTCHVSLPVLVDTGRNCPSLCLRTHYNTMFPS